MNDFAHLEKTIVRELSCRLCLCTDVVKLKPLSAEVKRKLKKLFDIAVRTDDNLPKAICHDCLQQVSMMHLYAVKVDKTQKFLEFHRSKAQEEKRDQQHQDLKQRPIIETLSMQNLQGNDKKSPVQPKAIPIQSEHQQGDVKSPPKQRSVKRKTPMEMKLMEAMPLEEFVKEEKLDKTFLNQPKHENEIKHVEVKHTENKRKDTHKNKIEYDDNLDSIVIVDGRPAKQGLELDKQITLFYKMECCICHENGFTFRSLMRHYKDRHGVPGYVTCCDKKFHYFYPKKIIEHMAYHLQPNIFMCPSCHTNFQTSVQLAEHQNNGGRSEGKILCPRCNERYPTYHELGQHIISHRADKMQCDYCGKQLKHHHRKKNINRMENVILCSHCIRTLRSIEKQEKEAKEKCKSKGTDSVALQKYQKFRKALGLSLSGDEDTSSD